MSSRNTVAPSLVAGLLAVGTISVASVANAASLPHLGPTKHIDTYVVEIGKRSGGAARVLAPRRDELARRARTVEAGPGEEGGVVRPLAFA